MEKCSLLVLSEQGLKEGGCDQNLKKGEQSLKGDLIQILKREDLLKNGVGSKTPHERGFLSL